MIPQWRIKQNRRDMHEKCCRDECGACHVGCRDAYIWPRSNKIQTQSQLAHLPKEASFRKKFNWILDIWDVSFRYAGLYQKHISAIQTRYQMTATLQHTQQQPHNFNNMIPCSAVLTCRLVSSLRIISMPLYTLNGCSLIHI